MAHCPQIQSSHQCFWPGMNTTNIVHRPRSHVGKWQIESKSVFGNKPSDADTPNRMAGTGFVSEIWVDAGRVQQHPPPGFLQRQKFAQTGTGSRKPPALLYLPSEAGWQGKQFRSGQTSSPSRKPGKEQPGQLSLATLQQGGQSQGRRSPSCQETSGHREPPGDHCGHPVPLKKDSPEPSCLHLFIIHYFTKYLLSTCSVPGSMLGTGDVSSEQDHVSGFQCGKRCNTRDKPTLHRGR